MKDVIFKQLDAKYEKYGNQMLSQFQVDNIIEVLSLGKLPPLKTVLLVDDAAFIRKVEREIFSECGYIVVAEAGDGRDAIEKYKQHCPDLVVMNITMPIMDGIQSTKEIRKIDENAVIVMFSGISSYQIVKESILAGASDFIVEKFEMDRFISAIKPKKQEENEEEDSQPNIEQEKAPVRPFFKQPLSAAQGRNEKPGLKKLITPGLESCWADKFDILDIKSPKTVIERQAKELKLLTNNQVIAVFTATKKELGEANDFKYEFNVTSPKVSNYIFSAFSISYNIDIYPCKFYLDEEIAKELKLPAKIVAKDDEEVVKLLGRILQSERLKYIISVLMAISK